MMIEDEAVGVANLVSYAEHYSSGWGDVVMKFFGMEGRMGALSGDGVGLISLLVLGMRLVGNVGRVVGLVGLAKYSSANVMIFLA